MSALDEKTQKSIERRRQAEAERKERIFNVKQRTLGVRFILLNHGSSFFN